MFHPLPIFIGLRYLRGRSGDKFGRFVSYMSTAGITIGVMSLITVTSVMNGFEGQLKQRILGVLPQAIIERHVDALPAAENMAATVLKWQGVEGTAPILRTDAVLQSPTSIGAGHLFGIDPNGDEPIHEFMVNGDITALTPHSYKVVLGRKTANQLGVYVGDKIRVMITSASQFTPIGRIPLQRNFEVAGIFETATDIDGQIFYANLDDVARLTRHPTAQLPDLRLFLSDPFDVPIMEQKAREHGYMWSDWRALRGELFQAVKMEKNMMGLMLSLIIIVASFNIISALIMVVMEKQSEVAILKTQGMTTGAIIAIFMVQGASSGAIGAVLGGGAGVLLASNLNEIMQILQVNLFGDGQLLPVNIKCEDVLLIVSSAIVLSLVAAFFPSIKAASVGPAEALRYE